MSDNILVALIVSVTGILTAMITGIIKYYTLISVERLKTNTVKPPEKELRESIQPDSKPLPKGERLTIGKIFRRVNWLITALVTLIVLLIGVGFLVQKWNNSPIPPGYIILDKFDDQKPLESIWNMGIDSENCFSQKEKGQLHIQCKENKSGTILLEYAPLDDEMSVLSGGSFSGIALSAKMFYPEPDNKAKVYFIVYFTGPDGQISARAYFVEMRFDSIKIVESYPKDPQDPWKDIELATIPVDSTSFHTMQVEYKSSKLRFFIDRKPVVLLIQPDLPVGSEWQGWILGSGIDTGEDQQSRVDALIDWVAVGMGQKP